MKKNQTPKATKKPTPKIKPAFSPKPAPRRLALLATAGQESSPSESQQPQSPTSEAAPLSVKSRKRK